MLVHVVISLCYVRRVVQELQQARQQLILGDLRKAMSEVKVDSQRRLTEVQPRTNRKWTFVSIELPMITGPCKLKRFSLPFMVRTKSSGLA